MSPWRCRLVIEMHRGFFWTADWADSVMAPMYQRAAPMPFLYEH